MPTRLGQCSPAGKTAPLIMTPASRQRYIKAHQEYQLKNYQAAKDFGVISTNMPKVASSNGLTRFILTYLTWMGHRCTRISSTGRMIGKPGQQRYIPGTTRRGAADLSATINGRSVMLEVKVGTDKPSEYQLREQELERKAGGIYEFIHDPQEFFEVYDKVLNLGLQQATLL